MTCKHCCLDHFTSLHLFLLIQSFTFNFHKSGQSYIHTSNSTQINNYYVTSYCYLLCLLLFISASLLTSPSSNLLTYYSSVNFRSRYFCIYLCNLCYIVQSEQSLITVNITVSSLCLRVLCTLNNDTHEQRINEGCHWRSIAVYRTHKHSSLYTL